VSNVPIIKWIWLAAIMAVFLLVALVIVRNCRSVSHSASYQCGWNLINILNAKMEWHLVEKKALEDRATWSDILPYMGKSTNGPILKCPKGGVYTIGRVEDPPTCSIGGVDHSLSRDWVRWYPLTNVNKVNK
jgi:hypothetical protein